MWSDFSMNSSFDGNRSGNRWSHSNLLQSLGPGPPCPLDNPVEPPQQASKLEARATLGVCLAMAVAMIMQVCCSAAGVGAESMQWLRGLFWRYSISGKEWDIPKKNPLILRSGRHGLDCRQRCWTAFGHAGWPTPRSPYRAGEITSTRHQRIKRVL